MQPPNLVIIGASARAAAQSAARAGFRPYWIDQYGDCDLAARFPGARVDAAAYPDGIAELLARAPAVPWLYTGAIENHPALLQRLAAQRPLLGNDAAVCAAVRTPEALHDCFTAAGIAAPRLAQARVPAGRWLSKPRRGAGGRGIALAEQGAATDAAHYLQEYVDGEACSGVFVGDGADAVLIGVCLQLVGRAEFHAAPFAYCGSIGPLPPADAEQAQWRAIGTALARRFGLRGLFGVDAIRARGAVLPLEVNPRYTASVEVHELAGAPACIGLHATGCAGQLPRVVLRPAAPLVAKAHLFAPAGFRFPPDFAAHALVPEGAAVEFADLPQPGTPIPAGAPILSVLARAEDEVACARLLAVVARRLYQALA